MTQQSNRFNSHYNNSHKHYHQWRKWTHWSPNKRICDRFQHTDFQIIWFVSQWKSSHFPTKPLEDMSDDFTGICGLEPINFDILSDIRNRCLQYIFISSGSLKSRIYRWKIHFLCHKLKFHIYFLFCCKFIQIDRNRIKFVWYIQSELLIGFHFHYM